MWGRSIPTECPGADITESEVLIFAYLLLGLYFLTSWMVTGDWEQFPSSNFRLPDIFSKNTKLQLWAPTAFLTHESSVHWWFRRFSFGPIVLLHYCLIVSIHLVSKKNSQNCFCHNFVKFSLTLIIFGMLMAKMTKLCKVH